MFCKAVSTSVKLARVPTVVPVRTLITCTNTDSYRRMNRTTPSPMYIQRRTFMGPLLRYATQFLASIGGTSIRAFFQAFQQAAAQAEGEENGQPIQQEFTLSKGMSISEALMVMNFKREDVNATSLSERFEQYFSANDPKHGGSFYLQSKVYRAHEALLDELDKFGCIRAESNTTPPPPPPASNDSE